MLRLIAREIRDHSVYFGACCVLSAIAISVLICMILYGVTGGWISIAYTLTGFLFFAFGILGAAQMCGDRANRISTLLSTQAVTRNRILAARIVTGVLAVLITLGPVLAVTLVLLTLKAPPLELYARMVWDISAVLLLMGLACHAVGLLIGWTNSKARLMAGSICLLLLLASLVVVKGFGLPTMAVLALLILAVWVKVWHTYVSASLSGYGYECAESPSHQRPVDQHRGHGCHIGGTVLGPLVLPSGAGQRAVRGDRPGADQSDWSLPVRESG